MAIDKRPPGAGDLTFELGGETLILRRSLGALIAFNQYNGRAGIFGVAGRAGLIDHLGNSDTEAAGFVIRQGLGLGPSAVKDLEERVFQEGVAAVCRKLIPWVTSLLSQPAAEGDETGGEGGAGGEENPQR